jgi:glycosyltransferase involved in cell wall biosynthesis
MKIGVTTMGCDAGKSGIGRYTAMLLSRWIEREENLQLFGHDSEREVWTGGRGVPWCSVAERWKNPLASIVWHQAVLPHKSKEVDVLFLPAGNRRLSWFVDVPSVGTVHDCSSLHVRGKYDRAREFYIKQVLPRMMQRLDHVITVSESTKRDLVGYCGLDPESVSVIPLAADHDVFFPRDKEQCRADLRRRFGLSNPFLLFTSRIEHPGKNHIRLIRAFNKLKLRTDIPHDLVFVGPERERAEEVRTFAARSLFAESIHFAGMIPDADLPLFYNAADCLVFPSLYEGFGLPLLEAMACGTRVVCSNRSSLPEVAGNAALLFDPEDPDDMAESMARMVFEPESKRESRVQASIRRAAEFSWSRTANTTLQLLKKVGGKLLSPELTTVHTAPHTISEPETSAVR